MTMHKTAQRCAEPEIRRRDGSLVPNCCASQERILRRLYGTESGRRLLKLLVKPAVSKCVGVSLEHPLSTVLIPPFIHCNQIDMSQYVCKTYRSYNAFFTREARAECRPVNQSPDALISPCDAKLSVYPITQDSLFAIKDSYYRAQDLLGCKRLADRFAGGLCLIFRLTVEDYHRYCYIDDGTKTSNRRLGGELHTVNPIALAQYNIYKRNCREVTLLHTAHFGDVAQVEVGALLVGKIVNHHGIHAMKRGEEKGMFEFGGSTVVLFLTRNQVRMDADILRNQAMGAETIVRFGEKIGEKER